HVVPSKCSTSERSRCVDGSKALPAAQTSSGPAASTDWMCKAVPGSEASVARLQLDPSQCSTSPGVSSELGKVARADTHTSSGPDAEMARVLPSRIGSPTWDQAVPSQCHGPVSVAAHTSSGAIASIEFTPETSSRGGSRVIDEPSQYNNRLRVCSGLPKSAL